MILRKSASERPENGHASAHDADHALFVREHVARQTALLEAIAANMAAIQALTESLSIPKWLRKR